MYIFMYNGFIGDHSGNWEVIVICNAGLIAMYVHKLEG